MKPLVPRNLLLLLGLAVVICSCAAPPPPADQPTPGTGDLVDASSPTPAASLTLSPTPTQTPLPTASPSSTVTPTVTQTHTPELPVRLGTALPHPQVIIHAGNISSLVELARLGDGELLRMQVSTDGSRLLAVFSTGLRVYDSHTLQQVGAFENTFLAVQSQQYAISPNGNYYADFDITRVRIWHTADGSLLHQFDLNYPPYLSHQVETFSFSPDEQGLILTLSIPYDPSITYFWRVNDGALLVEQRSLVNAFSPDGSLLAVAGWLDGVTRLYQSSNGALLRTLDGPRGLAKLSFSPDGTLLAAGYESSIWIWRLSDGQVVQQLYGKSGYYNELYFSQDGQVLFSQSGNLRIWQVGEGRQLVNLPDQFMPVLAPDGSRLVTTNYANEMLLWDVVQQRKIMKMAGFRGAYFSADGLRLIVDDSRNTYIIQAADGALLQTLEGESQALLLQDGQILLTVGQAGVQVRNAHTGELVRSLPGYMAVAYPTEDRMVTVEDGQIKLWDSATGELLNTTAGCRTRSVFQNTVPFSADGQSLLLGSPAGVQDLQLADLSARWVISDIQDAFALSPDRTLLANFTGQAIEIRQVADNNLFASIEADYVPRLVFSPDGRWLAGQNGWNRVTVWQVSDGSLLSSMTYPNSEFGEVQFSTDGRILFATAYGIGTTESLLAWQLPDGTLLRTQSYLDYYEVDRRDRTCDRRPFAISPDGRFLASGGPDCNTIVLSTNNWMYLQTLPTGMETQSVFYYFNLLVRQGGNMAFSPDGSLIATAFVGGEVKIWRVVDGTLVHTIIDHQSPAQDHPTVTMAFSPDGRYLVTSGLGITHLWGVWP